MVDLSRISPGCPGALPDRPLRHAALTANLLGLFFRGLEGSGLCRIFGAGLKIRAAGRDAVGRPGLSVVCGQPIVDAKDRGAITNPTLLANVLAPSTEGWDRGDGWQHYHELPTLQHYLLLSPEMPHVEHFQRLTGRSWRYTSIESGSSLTVLGVTLSMDALYANLPDDEP